MDENEGTVQSEIDDGSRSCWEHLCALRLSLYVRYPSHHEALVERLVGESPAVAIVGPDP